MIGCDCLTTKKIDREYFTTKKISCEYWQEKCSLLKKNLILLMSFYDHLIYIPHLHHQKSPTTNKIKLGIKVLSRSRGYWVTVEQWYKIYLKAFANEHLSLQYLFIYDRSTALFVTVIHWRYIYYISP